MREKFPTYITEWRQGMLSHNPLLPSFEAFYLGLCTLSSLAKMLTFGEKVAGKTDTYKVVKQRLMWVTRVYSTFQNLALHRVDK